MWWPFKKRSEERAPSILLQQLEERIVLDASIAPVTKENNTDSAQAIKTTDQTAIPGQTDAGPASATGAETAPSAQQLSQVFTTNLNDVIGTGDPAQIISVSGAVSPIDSGPDLNVVLISNSVTDIKAISEAAAPDAKVIVYDSLADNLSTLTAKLHELVGSAGRNIGVLTILEHGTQGILEIGTDRLSLSTITNYSDTFMSLSHDLSETAQIQFYACNLAGDYSGKAMLQYISVMSGAEVFASDDATGSTRGDWALEYATNPLIPMVKILNEQGLTSANVNLGAAELVTDLTSPISQVRHTTVFNDKLYFTAYNGSQYELYVCDGINPATLAPGADVSPAASSNPWYMTVYHDKLYFSADNGSQRELYVYDGTNPATLAPGADVNGTGSSDPWFMTVYHDKLYFTAYNGSQSELYVYDGTNPATLAPGADVNPWFSSRPIFMTVYHDKLYFMAYNGSQQGELFVYDGTNPATLAPGADVNSTGSSDPVYMTVYQNKLYFQAYNGTQYELYEYDDANPAKLAPGADVNETDGSSSRPQFMTVYQNKLYFHAYNGTQYELYEYDGTNPAMLAPGSNVNPTGGSYPAHMTVYDDKLYFTAYNGSLSQLYAYDGINPAILAPDRDATISSSPSFMTVYNDKLYFTAYNGSQYELYEYGGTNPATLVPGADVNGTGGSSPQFMTVYHDKLYFTAYDGNQYELYMYDGTYAMRAPGADVNGTGGSYPCDMTVYHDKLYFQAYDGTQYELYMYDGINPAILAPGADVNGTGGSYPYDMTVYHDKLYFTAYNGTQYELYEYDGTNPATLAPGADINGTAGSYPQSITVYNDKLYFTAYNGSQRELYVYDGTNPATLAPGADVNTAGSSNPCDMTVYNDKLYFSADNGSQRELYVYDGTNPATLVAGADVNAAGGSNPHEMTVYNDKLYFSAYNPEHGYELWSWASSSVPTDLTGTAGSDELYIAVDQTVNNVYALDGDDTVHVSGTVLGTIDGGEGSDHLEIKGFSKITIFGNASNGYAVYGDNQELHWRNFESIDVYGSDGDDNIIIAGEATVNNIYGAAGNDVIQNVGWVQGRIVGDAGADRIINHAGAVVEEIFGGSENDYVQNSGLVVSNVYSEDGDDFLYTHGQIGGYLIGGAGSDTIEMEVGTIAVTGEAANGSAVYDSGLSAQWLDAEHVQIRGTTVTINTGAVVDYVIGTMGDDTITNHGTVLNFIGGGGGADQIFNSGIVESVNGNSGDDTIFNYGTGTVGSNIYGDQGIDTIHNFGTIGGNIYGGDGDDHIEQYDNATVQSIFGESGIDTIYNYNGTVVGNIYGGDGDDWIQQFSTSKLASVQSIFGEAGNDLIIVNSHVTGHIDAGGDIRDALVLTYYGDLSYYGTALDGQMIVDGSDTLSWMNFSKTTIEPWFYAGIPSNILINLDAATFGIWSFGNDVITNKGTVQQISCGDGTQQVQNWGQIDSVHGGAGDDQVINNPGGYIGAVYGDDGKDQILNFAGASMGYIDGGAGDDSIHNNGYAQSILGGAGIDLLDLARGSQADYVDPGSDFDWVHVFDSNVKGIIPGGTGDNDEITLYGNITIFGSAADGTVVFGSGKTVSWQGFGHIVAAGDGTEISNITVSQGADVWFVIGYGDTPHNIVNFGTVAEFINGGGGPDTISNYGIVSSYIRGGTGDDKINNYGTVMLDIIGGSGDDSIRLYGASIGGVVDGSDHTTGDSLHLGPGFLNIAGNAGSGSAEFNEEPVHWINFEQLIIPNLAPTDITLSSNTIPENSGVDAIVGTLGAVDPDSGDTHVFSLTAGAGNNDNDLFDIIDGNLVAKNSFDYESVDSYTVHVKATDSGGLSVEKDLIVGVTNVNEAPVAGNISLVVDEGIYVTGNVLAQVTDLDSSSITVSMVNSPTHGSLSFDADGSFTYTPDANWNGTDNFTYKANDGILDSNVASVAITVNAVNDAPVVQSSHPAGALDLSFGLDHTGKVTTDFDGKWDSGSSLVVQPDGKIIFMGDSANVTGGQWEDWDFSLARYNQDGILDNSFGTGGKVTTDFSGFDNFAGSVAVQNDGKIIVAGEVYNGTSDSGHLAIARYYETGHLDKSFGTDGFVTDDLGSEGGYWESVLIQSDGKIVVLGGVNFAGDFKTVLARYYSDGNLDDTFHGDGKVIVPFDYPSGNWDLAIQSNGSIVVAGSSAVGETFALARYDINGLLDNSFSEDGLVTTDFGYGSSVSVAIQSDGKIVLAGFDSNSDNYSANLCLTRFNQNGSPDTDFGNQSLFLIPQLKTMAWQSTVDLAVQQDGKLIVAGYGHMYSWDFFVARVNPQGTIDDSFGTHGIVATEFGTDYSYSLAHAIALQSDGKIVVGGAVTNTDATNFFGDYAVARYLPDPSFNYTEGSGPVVMDSGIRVSDVDSTTLDHAIIAFGNHYHQGEDFLRFTNTDSITGSWDAATGTLILSGKDTVAHYQDALRTVAYENTSENPHTDTRSINWTVNDGLTDSSAQTLLISVKALYEPMSADIPNPPALAEDFGIFTYNIAPYFADMDSSILTYEMGTVTYHDGLAFYELSVNSTTGVVTAWSEWNSFGSADVKVRAYDGRLYSEWEPFTITVNSVNDAPKNIMPYSSSTPKDTAIEFSSANGNLISVDDVDSAGGKIRMSIYVNNGEVTLKQTTGLEFYDAAIPRPVGDQLIRFIGTLADVRSAMDGMIFTPNPGYEGWASIGIGSNDNGNTGAGGPLGDMDKLDISVGNAGTIPMNQSPVVNVPMNFSTIENNTVRISPSISDADADDAFIAVKLNAPNGSLFVRHPGIVEFIEGDGVNDGTIYMVGTVQNINTTLAGMLYKPGVNQTGALGFSIAVSDLGNQGLDNTVFVPYWVNVQVTEGNDAPVFTLPAVESTPVDTPLVFAETNHNKISVWDEDAGSEQLRFTIYTTNGSVSFTEGTGMVPIPTMTAPDGDQLLMVYATQDQFNIALEGMTFTPKSGYEGWAEIFVAASDLGKTGIGGAQSAMSKIDITVGNPVSMPVEQDPVTHSPMDLVVHKNVTEPLFGPGKTVWISDSDIGDKFIAVRVWGGPGLFSMTNINNIGFVDGDGTNDPMLFFYGKLEDVNTSLASLSFTPATNFTGYAGLYVQPIDLGNGTGPLAFDLDLTILQVVNDAPMASDMFLTGKANTAFSGALAGSDINGEVLSFSIVTAPVHGTVNLNSTTGAFTYNPSQDYIGPDSFTYKAFDGSLYSDFKAVTLDITVPNHNPVAGNIQIEPNEGAAYAINGWSFSDADGDGAQSLIIKSSPGSGMLFLDSNNNDTIDLGETVNINQDIPWAQVGKVKYLGNPYYNGPDSFQYAFKDTAGLVGTLPSEIGTVSINVTALNDAPVNSVPGVQSVEDAAQLVFSSANGNLITTSDIDAGSADLKVTLTVTNGTMTLPTFANLNFSTGGGTSDSTMVFTGKLNDIKTALNGMYFVSNTGYVGSALLTIKTEDQGNTGEGGFKTDTDTVAITIKNAQPVAGAFATTNINEEIVGAINGWNFTDVENNIAKSVKILELPQHGTLFLDSNNNGVIETGEAIVVGQEIAWNLAKTTPRIKYLGVQDYAGPDQVVYSIKDATGTENPAKQAMGTIDVKPVNDYPSSFVTTPLQTNEDTDVILTNAQIRVSDVDSDLTVQLTSSRGIMTLANGMSGTSIVFTDTVANVNNALSGMRFTPTGNYNGSGSITLYVSDEGEYVDSYQNSYTGTIRTDRDVITITISPVPDAPVAKNFSVTAMEDLATPALSGWTFTDADQDAAQSVIITKTPGYGRLFLDGNGNGIIDSGEQLSVGSEVSWSLAKTTPAVKYLGYQYYNGADSFQYVVRDATGLTGSSLGETGTVSITLNAVNNGPFNQAPFAITTPEDTAFSFLKNTPSVISVSDVDAGTNPLKISLSSTNGTLTIPLASRPATFTVGDGEADASMTFTGSLETINKALDGLIFNPKYNYNGTATITIATNDQGYTGSGGAKSKTDKIAVTITPVPDNPKATSFNLAATEDVVKTVNAWAFTDPDGLAAEAIMIVQSPSHGTLFYDADANNIYDSGEEIIANEEIVTWVDAKTGAKVKYIGDPYYNGQDTFQYVVINSADAQGSSPSELGTVSVTVAAVNNAPVNSLPPAQTINEDTILILGGSNAIQINDPDSGPGLMKVTLTATHGTIQLADSTGIAVTGNGESIVTLFGEKGLINTALDGLKFTPEENYYGAASIKIVTDDQGNSGGAAKTATNNLNITLKAVNDAPVITVPVTYVPSSPGKMIEFNQSSGYVIHISDDSRTSQIEVQLTATNGTMTLSGTTGLRFLSVNKVLPDGVNDSVIKMRGTLAAINSALNGMTFATGAEGQASINISTNDLGAYGSGGQLTAEATVKIDVGNSDGSAHRILDVKSQSTGFRPDLIKVGGNLFFLDYLESTGYELWKVDGSSQAMIKVKQFDFGFIPAELTDVNGILFFAGWSPGVEKTLWKSDGTQNGTAPISLHDPLLGLVPHNPYDLVNVNGSLFFFSTSDDQKPHLWKTDGTAFGTSMIKQISDLTYNPPSNLIAVNQLAFFTAYDQQHGYELWRSDGTPDGTMMLEIVPGPEGSYPLDLANMNGTLYFRAILPDYGCELWKSDGTVYGTTMIKNIAFGSESSIPRNFTYIDGTVFFTADDGEHGRELWVTDGTEANTVMVKDLNPGIADGVLGELININGTCYFIGNNGSIGYELFKSTGLDSSTTLVKDIDTSQDEIYYQRPYNLTNVNGRIIFSANDGQNGYELWESNGTEQQTHMVRDVNIGSNGSYPHDLIDLDGTVFFLANNGSREGLYKYTPLGLQPPNQAPIVESQLPDITVDEDAAPSKINLITAFHDSEDGDNLFYSVIKNTNPDLFSFTRIDQNDHGLVLGYYPDKNGSTEITLQAKDSEGKIVEQHFKVTVDSVPDAPRIFSPGTVYGDLGRDVVFDGNFFITDPDFPGEDRSLSVMLSWNSDYRSDIHLSADLVQQSTFESGGKEFLVFSSNLSSINAELKGMIYYSEGLSTGDQFINVQVFEHRTPISYSSSAQLKVHFQPIVLHTVDDFYVVFDSGSSLTSYMFTPNADLSELRPVPVGAGLAFNVMYDSPQSQRWINGLWETPTVPHNFDFMELDFIQEAAQLYEQANINFGLTDNRLIDGRGWGSRTPIDDPTDPDFGLTSAEIAAKYNVHLVWDRANPNDRLSEPVARLFGWSWTPFYHGTIQNNSGESVLDIYVKDLKKVNADVPECDLDKGIDVAFIANDELRMHAKPDLFNDTTFLVFYDPENFTLANFADDVAMISYTMGSSFYGSDRLISDLFIIQHGAVGSLVIGKDIINDGSVEKEGFNPINTYYYYHTTNSDGSPNNYVQGNLRKISECLTSNAQFQIFECFVAGNPSTDPDGSAREMLHEVAHLLSVDKSWRNQNVTVYASSDSTTFAWFTTTSYHKIIGDWTLEFGVDTSDWLVDLYRYRPVFKCQNMDPAYRDVGPWYNEAPVFVF